MDRWIDELAEESFAKHAPALVGFTAPFPGTLYGAFRIARRLKALAPSVVTVLGGGYVNTELRALDESRVFDTFDYVCFDDGEIPLLRIVEAQSHPSTALVRTRIRRDGQVIFCDDPTAPRLRHRERPAALVAPTEGECIGTSAGADTGEWSRAADAQNANRRPSARPPMQPG